MSAPPSDELALGQDLTGDQRRVLQVIYDVWNTRALEWPFSRYIDNILDKQHGIDLSLVLPTIPLRYIIYNTYSPTDTELRLTVAGIASCEGSAGDMTVFLRGLRWCVERERTFQPSSPTTQEDLRLTSQDAEHDWSAAGGEETPIIINKAFALLTSENITHGHGKGPDGWTITITRDVRRFRNVQTLADYVAIKEKPRDVPSSIVYTAPPRLPIGSHGLDATGYPLLQGSAMETLASVQQPVASPDPRKVFVIHGRDEEARNAVFEFLRGLDLHPLPWEELVAATGRGAPYNGDVVSRAFDKAQAILVVLTPDDEARLHADLHSDHEEDYERELSGQARPNVLLEAGMALMAQPDRTIFVEIGRLRPVSDLSGRNTVRLGGSAGPLLALRDRLSSAGCAVNDKNSSWMETGRFASLAARTRQPARSIPTEARLPRGQRLTSRPKPAEPSLSARLLDRGQHNYLLEVVNRGGVTLRNVTWEPTPQAPNWGFLNQVLPSYPYDELPPREYVRVPATITMGGPVVIDLTLSGETPDGARYERRVRLSVYG